MKMQFNIPKNTVKLTSSMPNLILYHFLLYSLGIAAGESQNDADICTKQCLKLYMVSSGDIIFHLR